MASGLAPSNRKTRNGVDDRLLASFAPVLSVIRR